MELKHSKDMIVTDVYLYEEFRNKQTAPAYKITTPDGYEEIIRQTLSDGCQIMKLLAHLGAQVETLHEEREVRGCNLKGCALKLVDLKILQYTSNDKRAAAETYHKIVKPELEKMGYHVQKHECYPYVLKKPEPDCHKNTLKQDFK